MKLKMIAILTIVLLPTSIAAQQPDAKETAVMLGKVSAS
jgi:hypothetical protein